MQIKCLRDSGSYLLSCRGIALAENKVMISSVSLFPLFTGGDLSRRWASMFSVSVSWVCVCVCESVNVCTSVNHKSSENATLKASWLMDGEFWDGQRSGWMDEWKNEILLMRTLVCSPSSSCDWMPLLIVEFLLWNFVYTSACTACFYCIFKVILKDLWYSPGQTYYASKFISFVWLKCWVELIYWLEFLHIAVYNVNKHLQMENTISSVSLSESFSSSVVFLRKPRLFPSYVFEIYLH